MPKELLDLTVDEISLVDSPANPGAQMLIWKRAEKNEEQGYVTCSKCGAQAMKGATECPKCGAPMNNPAAEPPEEKRMDELKAQNAKLEADLKAAEELATEEQKKREAAEAKVKALELDLAKSKLTPEAADKKIEALEAEVKLARMSPEERKKAERASLPESVRKQLEDNETQIAKMVEERDAATFEKRAGDLGLAGVSPAKLGPVLKRIAKGQSNAEDLADLETLLKAFGARQKMGKLFEEFGKGGFESGEPRSDTKVMARAKELQKADPKLNIADAITKVLAEDPSLQDAYLAESRGQA